MLWSAWINFLKCSMLYYCAVAKMSIHGGVKKLITYLTKDFSNTIVTIPISNIDSVHLYTKFKYSICKLLNWSLKMYLWIHACQFNNKFNLRAECALKICDIYKQYNILLIWIRSIHTTYLGQTDKLFWITKLTELIINI